MPRPINQIRWEFRQRFRVVSMGSQIHDLDTQFLHLTFNKTYNSEFFFKSGKQTYNLIEKILHPSMAH